jgi:hypothetical protein
MNTLALRHYPATNPERLRWLSAGFIFGFLAVLVFHQGAFGLLNAVGLTPIAPHPMDPTEPFGVPRFWSLAAWGGLWGVLLAAAVHRLHGIRLVFAGALFGLVVPTLAAWFIVPAIKGQPLAAGFVPEAMAVGLIVNAAWGLGTGLGLAALSGRRRYY